MFFTPFNQFNILFYISYNFTKFSFKFNLFYFKYRLNIKNFSCHSLRKTFGRQVFNMSGENSEMALVKLMEIYNHSNMSLTKRYLGLKNDEIKETYDLLRF